MSISAGDWGNVLSIEAVTPGSNPRFGSLTLTTDIGKIVLRINHDTAFALIEKLVDFIDPDESSPVTS